MSETIELSMNHLDFLHNCVICANSMGMDYLIFKPGKIGGGDEVKSRFIVDDLQTELPFENAAINRVGELLNRINFFVENNDNIENIKILAEMHPTDTTSIYKLHLTSPSVNVEYKFGNISAFKGKVPSKLNDETICHLTIQPQEIKQMLSANQLMKPENIQLKISDGNVQFAFADKLSDNTSVTVEHQTDDNVDFDHQFPADAISCLLRNFRKKEPVDLIVGEKFLSATVNDLRTHILRKA